jgi:NDP-sugar pyrophosphorylase family protein
MLAAGGLPLGSLVTWRPWHDLGTPARYLAAVIDWSRRRGGRAAGWVSPAAAVAQGAAIERSVVEAGARVDAGARITRSLLLPGAVAQAGARIEEALIGPGAVVPAGLQVSGDLATLWREDLPPGGRRAGDLLLTPLGRQAAASG